MISGERIYLHTYKFASQYLECQRRTGVGVCMSTLHAGTLSSTKRMGLGYTEKDKAGWDPQVLALFSF